MKTLNLLLLLILCCFLLNGCATVSKNSPKDLSPNNEVCGNLKSQMALNDNPNVPDQQGYGYNPIVTASLYKQYEHYDCERANQPYQPPLLSQNDNHINVINE